MMNTSSCTFCPLMSVGLFGFSHKSQFPLFIDLIKLLPLIDIIDLFGYVFQLRLQIINVSLRVHLHVHITLKL